MSQILKNIFCKSFTERALRLLLVSTAVFALSACLSVPNLNPFSDDADSNASALDEKAQNENAQNEQALSEQALEEREALARGKSSRPSLKSLDLQPVRMDEVAVPALSLEQKREQYEALLPMLKDPIQKQQVAFRLADIKMLIAEETQQEGTDIEPVEVAFADAISDYEKVLSEHDIVTPVQGIALSEEQQALNRKQMDAMYQLTRALDLAAQPVKSMQTAKAFLETFDAKQFSVTPYHLELYFRIGEYYFNRQQYSTAVDYYGQVVANGNTNTNREQGNFFAISAYMLGWSHFKLDQYDPSMQAFATMLDASLLANPALSLSDIQEQALDKLEMPRGELRIVKDSVRVMALTFSYQGNGDAIKQFFAQYGNRDYEQLIYDELAQQHLDNDRFQDSANVLVTFADAYPLHPRAVEFYIRHIDAFVLGDFPARVLAAKEAFVQTYSLGNGVVSSFETPVGRAASPYLRDYIKQLAQTEHSIAQGIDSVLARRAASSANVSDSETSASGFVASNLSEAQNTAWALASNADLEALANTSYTKAKGYYENFIRSFSPDPEIAPLRFYLAEALLALDEYEAAIEAFETYAYYDEFDASSQAPAPVEAAYAALLIYQKMADANISVTPAIDASSSMALISPFSLPLSMHQSSQSRFITIFASDKRSPTVALTLMQDLFAQSNYLPAQEWATWLLSQHDLSTSNASAATAKTLVITSEMRESAMLVMAHSHFAMDAFAQAEIAYRDILATMPVEDNRRDDLIDRLAASLYKQAETLLVNAKLDTANLQAQQITRKAQLTPIQLSTLEQGVAILTKVVSDTPLSEFRLAAQYDSAIYHLLLENWQSAIDTFLDFKQRYPNDPLSAGIDNQLFYAYEQTQDWAKAATMLMAKYNQSPNTDTGRLALFQAAEYFEKAGDRDNALDKFRTYAHAFEQPMADANEARFKLSEFYLESGEDSKRRFWLNKLVNAQLDVMNNRPSESTARSVYLASMGALVFASDADKAFTRIKLTQPLASSLKKKQAALKKAIFEYDRVISFGSAEYVTAANYKLGQLYSKLANDLMDSSRPDGLSALELSQYEILLEEQAYPFEETAIDLHEKNIARVQVGLYDEWIKNSYTALKNTNPGRYNKPEVIAEVNADDF